MGKAYILGGVESLGRFWREGEGDDMCLWIGYYGEG